MRVIVLTVAPDEDQEAYLQLLSGISRRFKDPQLIEDLIDAADDVPRIFEIIKNLEA